jgi:hypothetical protein
MWFNGGIAGKDGRVNRSEVRQHTVTRDFANMKILLVFGLKEAL